MYFLFLLLKKKKTLLKEMPCRWTQQQEIKIESTVWLRMIRLTVWPPYSINKGGEDGGDPAFI